MTPADAVSRALAEFGITPGSKPVRLHAGALNRNYRVESPNGELFLRRHREGVGREAVEREHFIVRRASKLGIPVAVPLEVSAAGSIVTVDESEWSLFPWVSGRQLIRGRSSRRDVHALGELLGRIHAAFADEPYGVPVQLGWDTAASHERLERMARSKLAARQPAFAEGIRERLRLLEEGNAQPPRAFESLPLQLCHGDFHDKQVIFAPQSPEPLAVTDWEMAAARPRTWELVRSLVFARLDGRRTLDAFCAGYRKHVRIPRDEAEMGVELWWQGRLHETWALEELFLKGNQRVRQFVPDGFRHLHDLSEPSYRERLALAIANVR